MSVTRVKQKIKAGDQVTIISGNHRGKAGKVLLVFPRENKAIVEGVNKVVYFTKPTQKEPKRMMKRKEAPLAISNLMVLDRATNTPSRVGRKQNEAGKWQRYAKKTGNFL